MGVFNATQGQVLISPVTSYYQGNAMRQQAADAKQESVLKERRADLQERQVENQEEQFDFMRQQYTDEVGEKRAKRAAFDLWSITEQVNKKFSDGGKTEESQAESLVFAEQLIRDYADGLPDGKSKSKTMKQLEGGITAEEYQSILPVAASNAAFYGFSNPGRKLTTVAKGADVIDEDGNVVYSNPDEGSSSAKTHINYYNPDTGENVAARPDSEFADSLVANGFLVGNPKDESTGPKDTEVRLSSAAISKGVHARYGGLFGPSGELIPLEKGLANKEGAVTRHAMKLWKAANGELDPETAADIAFNLVEQGDLSIEEIRGETMSDEDRDGIINAFSLSGVNDPTEQQIWDAYKAIE